jgi:hypothetical protein
MTAAHEFLERIRQTLIKNGFPAKRVALPEAQLSASAQARGLDLDLVLGDLRRQFVGHTREGTRLVFEPLLPEGDDAPSPALLEKMRDFAEQFRDIDPSELAALQGMNKFKQLWKIRELMKKIPPERLARAEELIQGLSDDDKKRMMSFASRFQQG